jgi:hypothetical protein
MRRMPETAPAPLLSVVVPMEDDRGELAENLSTWTRRQTLERDRFQVVVVSPGDPEGEEIVRTILAPHDRIVRTDSDDIIEHWNSGAREAGSGWLFLTEAHCLGEPDCLADVVRALESAGPETEVVTVEHGHVTDSKVERLGADWFDEVYEQWNAPDAWTRLNLVGFAIRRDTYFGEGGLEPRYGMFSAPMLSARLYDRAAPTVHAAKALVLHKQNHHIREHHEFSGDYARGECEARGDVDPRFGARYFGHQEAWANQLRYRTEIARPLAGTLALATARAALRRHPDAGWLARETLRALPAAVAGARPALALSSLVFAVEEQLAIRLPEPMTRRRRGYTKALRWAVALGELRWLRDSAGPPLAPPLAGEGRWSPADLGPQALVGAHGLEEVEGAPLRWTWPVSAFRIAPPPGDSKLILETSGVGGVPRERVRAVYAGGKRIAADGLGGHATRLEIPLAADQRDRIARHGVVVLTRPLQAPADSPDRRTLGLPLRAVEVAVA